MNTLKNLIHFTAGLYLLSFLDGLFSIGFGEPFYILIGFLMLGAMIWMLYIIHSDSYKLN